MVLKSFLGLLLAMFAFGILFFFSPDLQKLFRSSSNPGDQVTRLFESLMTAPEVFLASENHDKKESKTQSSCEYYTCFDVYRCGGRQLTVHIPQPIKVLLNSKESREISPLTKEYVDILGNITFIRLLFGISILLLSLNEKRDKVYCICLCD